MSTKGLKVTRMTYSTIMQVAKWVEARREECTTGHLTTLATQATADLGFYVGPSSIRRAISACGIVRPTRTYQTKANKHSDLVVVAKSLESLYVSLGAAVPKPFAELLNRLDQ